MKVLNNRELEYKYSADGVCLEKFTAFALAQKPTESLSVCGFDTFYASPGDPNTFLRHRIGDNFNQLTVKRKLTDKNNFLRDEINLTLSKDTSEETLHALATIMGFEFNRKIFKTVFVHTYPRYVLAYYVVYDLDMVELGRFLEIEMSENHQWEYAGEPWELLKTIESEARVLGITPQGRIKKSLYEQFRKEIK